MPRLASRTWYCVSPATPGAGNGSELRAASSAATPPSASPENTGTPGSAESPPLSVIVELEHPVSRAAAAAVTATILAILMAGPFSGVPRLATDDSRPVDVSGTRRRGQEAPEDLVTVR